MVCSGGSDAWRLFFLVLTKVKRSFSLAFGTLLIQVLVILESCFVHVMS